MNRYKSGKILNLPMDVWRETTKMFVFTVHVQRAFRENAYFFNI